MTQTPSRTWLANGLLLAMLTLFVYRVTDGEWQLAVVRTMSLAMQLVAFLAAYDLLAPQARAHARRVISGLKDFGAFLVATLTGALAFTILGLSWSWTIDDITWAGSLNLWARNVAGIVGVGGVGMVAAGTGLRLVRTARWGRWAEALALISVTVGLYYLDFVLLERFPLDFLLFVPVLWASLRFSVAAAGLVALMSAAMIVALTLVERGPFAVIESPDARALVAQLFAVAIVVVALTLALARDEQQSAEQRARASTAVAQEHLDQIRHIVNTVRDGIEVVREDGTVLLTNPVADRILGRGSESDPARLPSLAESGLSRPDGTALPETFRPWRRALDEGGVVVDEVRLTRSGQRDRMLRVTAVPAEGPDHDPARRAIVVFHDITDDVDQREVLSSFAGVVAHDLLNPVGVMDGWAEELQRELQESGAVSADDALPMIHRIRSATDSMRRLIGDLLGFTTARDRTLQPTRIDLHALLEELVVLRTASRDARLSPHIDVGPMATIVGDPLLVRQLLDNLIGNAVKYVAQGVVPHVRIDITDRRDERVTLTISDNGIGIPEEQRSRVFDQFHRAHPEGYTGTGLGLAICARIVDRHGGSIRVEEEPATGGSRFIFSLPTTAAALAAASH